MLFGVYVVTEVEEFRKTNLRVTELLGHLRKKCPNDSLMSRFVHV